MSLFQNKSLRGKGSPQVSCPLLIFPPGFDLLLSVGLKHIDWPPGGIRGWAGCVKIERRSENDTPEEIIAFHANPKEMPL